jgi:hypothetical protein
VKGFASPDFKAVEGRSGDALGKGTRKSRDFCDVEDFGNYSQGFRVTHGETLFVCSLLKTIKHIHHLLRNTRFTGYSLPLPPLSLFSPYPHIPPHCPKDHHDKYRSQTARNPKSGRQNSQSRTRLDPLQPEVSVLRALTQSDLICGA